MFSCTIPLPSARLRFGQVASCLTLLLFGGFINIIQPKEALEQTLALGFAQTTILPIGLSIVAAVILYFIPRTAVLGAILITGYLGGAVCLHTLKGDPLLQLSAPIVFGVLIWGGLFLRDPRVRALIPVSG